MAQPRRVIYDSEDSEDDSNAVRPVFCPSSPPVPAAAAELRLPAATPTPPTDVSISDDPWAVPYSPPRAVVPAKPTELPRKKESSHDGATSKKRKRVDAEATDGRLLPERTSTSTSTSTSTTSHILEIALPMESVSSKKRQQQQQQQPAQEPEDCDELAPSATTPPKQKRPSVLQLLSSPDVIAEPSGRKPLPRPPPVSPPAGLIIDREVRSAVEDGRHEEVPAKQTKRKRTPKPPQECGLLAEDDELLQVGRVQIEEPVALITEPAPAETVAAEPPAKAPADHGGNTQAKPKRPRGRPKKKKETESTTSATDTTTAAVPEAVHETAVPPVVPRKESEQRTAPAAAEATLAAATTNSSGDRREASSTDAHPGEAEKVAPLVENKPVLPAAAPPSPPPRPASLKLSSTAQGRVPFRVGLSRTTRIAPLLKSLKK